jgi:antitoxin (DNA-binding transcriptional repressor) of toxin-antitoxin stability system
MKSITMLEFRKRADSVLKQVAKGNAFLLTYRGKPVAKLEPVGGSTISDEDPIYRLHELASGKAKPLDNFEIDQIVYGQ